jgi:hypothetical protein
MIMQPRKPRYSMEEHYRRAEQLYAQLRPQLEAGNHGKILALDVDSGEYELGDDTMTTTNRLLARRPDAQIWCYRIGYPAVFRFGGRLKPQGAP